MSGFVALVMFAGWCGVLAVGAYLADWLNRRQS